MECFHCQKTSLYGRSHTHHRGVAGGRWKKRAVKTNRIFKVNLQKVKIILNEVETQVLLCTKCLKRIRKDMIDGKKPFYKLAGKLRSSETQTPAEVEVKKPKTVKAKIVKEKKVAIEEVNKNVDTIPALA